MIVARRHGGLVIALSLLTALMLTIVPLPESAEPYRPEWALLVVVYWTLALPERVGVGVAWVVGLLLDGLKGALLGQHALALAVVAFIALNLHQRIRLFPLWQQALTVLVLMGLYQLLVLWFEGITGAPARDWTYWGASLTGMLLWPGVFLLLRDLRRRFMIS